MAELTREQISAAVYEAARHVGIPGYKASDFLEVLKMCGLELRPTEFAAAQGQGSKVIASGGDAGSTPAPVSAPPAGTEEG